MPIESRLWHSRENYLVGPERRKPPTQQRFENAFDVTERDDGDDARLLKNKDNRLIQCQDFEIHWYVMYDDFHTY